MKFSRIGEHTIKCTITEQEIGDLGYTIDDILSNSERTQEFMNQIFDMAEKEFQTKFDLGIKTVRADFMSDHTLSLTFSEHPVNGMMEHLKDIIGGLIGSFAKEKLGDFSQELEKATKELANAAENAAAAGGAAGASEQTKDEEQEVRVIALFTFDSMDIVTAFAKQVDVEPIPPNALYKWEEKYIITTELSSCNEKEVLRLSVLTDEYASNIQVGAEKRAFLQEHARCIIKEHAIEQLKLL